MILRNRMTGCVPVMMLVLAVGCVQPGDVDPGVLARYQRIMMERSPRKRVGVEGLESLRPAAGTTGPVARIVRDEATGKARVEVTLDQVVQWALANNPDIAVVSFDPAISREETIAAAAAFDYTVFADYNKTYTDQRPRAGSALATRTSTNQTAVGVRQTTITGADWSITADLTRTWDDAGVTTFNEAWEPTLAFTMTQPLLRGGWPDFNLATLRIARINERTSYEQFRQAVQESITNAVAAYWAVVRARRARVIQQQLVRATQGTLEKVKARMDFDATIVQHAQLESALASRKALEIQARKNIEDAEQALGRLVAHEQINVLTDYEIVPLTEPVESKVAIDPADQLLMALRHNPQLAQARLALATADINVDVARNQALPSLDFTAGVMWQGQGHTLHAAKEQFNSGDYLSYNLGFEFEYPIGNRERRADVRRTRLQRLKTVTQIQSTADMIAVTVGERIRQIHSSYEEMQAQKAAMKAARVHLKALEDSEIRQRLTPEYLNVKLNAQTSVAQAELELIRAIVTYNTAIVELARETGTVLELHRVKLALPALLNKAR